MLTNRANVKFLVYTSGTKAAVRDGVLEMESNDLETLLQRPVTPINEALNKLILLLNNN